MLPLPMLGAKLLLDMPACAPLDGYCTPHVSSPGGPFLWLLPV